MAERVYVCDNSELNSLKSRLEFDPALSPDIVSSGPDKPDSKMSEEEKRANAEGAARREEFLKKLSEDKYADLIFVRQEYSIRDGAISGLDKDKSYIYISASEEFLDKAEKMFAERFKSVSRAPKEQEDKLLATIKDEKDKGNAGFGAIFG